MKYIAYLTIVLMFSFLGLSLGLYVIETYLIQPLNHQQIISKGE